MKHKLLLVFLFFSVVMFAQSGKRPVVGLVLSGGGAKGIAHVGSLKILDSLGIHVDYVAGTSMGSVIGGLYAVGYSPEQLKDEVLGADWGDLMSDLPKRQYLSYEEKDVPQRYIFSTALEGFKVHVPSGILSGNNIEAKLNQMFIGYQEDTNFLELPRGFVCVAADINKAEEYVMTEGSLPEAIRASMSIPSVFDPFIIDGRVLVDGGTLNNFPSDKLKELGCDIIIGISVQELEPDTVVKPSLVDVLEKTSMFIDYSTTAERNELCDIIVRPNMEEYNMMSFEAYDGIYEVGVSGARKQVEELAKLADYLSQWETEETKPYVVHDSVYVNSIKIVGNNTISEKLIMGIFNVEEGGYFSVDFLDEELKQLYGTGNFFKVKYDLNTTEVPDRFDMVLRITESPTNTEVGVGLHLDTDFGVQALINFTHRSFLLEGSKLGFDAIIRANPYFKFYYYYDRGLKPGFGMYSRVYTAKPDLYAGTAFIGQVSINDWSNSLYIQSTNLNSAMLQLGMQFDLMNYNLEKVPNWSSRWPEHKLGLTYLNLFARLEMDNLDHSVFPSKGASGYLVATAHHLQAETFDEFDYNPFLILKLNFLKVLKANSKLVFIPEVNAGVTLNGESSVPYYFYRGSMGRNYIHNNKSFPGYRFMELNFVEDSDTTFAQNITTVELSVRYNLYKSHYVTAFGGLGIASKNVDNLFDSHQFGGFGIKYSIRSSLGPMELAVHKSTESGLIHVYYNLGYWF